MAGDEQNKAAERSPLAAATRGELYSGFFVIWIFLSLAFGRLLAVEPSWQTALFFTVSFLLMVVYAVAFVRIWWASRRGSHGQSRG